MHSHTKPAIKHRFICLGEAKLLQTLAIKIKAKNGGNEEVIVHWERVAYNNGANHG